MSLTFCCADKIQPIDAETVDKNARSSSATQSKKDRERGKDKEKTGDGERSKKDKDRAAKNAAENVQKNVRKIHQKALKPGSNQSEQEASLRQMLNNSDGNKAVHLGNLGNLLFRRGQVAEAEEVYAAAVKAGNRNPGHLGNYALLFMKKGEPFETQAETMFLKALNVQPNHGINVGNYANLVLRQGRLDEADKLYKRALMADMGNVDNRQLEQVIAGYAATLKAQGKVTEAMEQYGNAIAANPSSHAVHLNNYAELLGKEGR